MNNGDIFSDLPGPDSPSPPVSDSRRTQGSPLRPPVSPSPPLLIGLGGKSGAGKDTAAAYLVEQGYFQLGFADCLKEVVGIAFDLDVPQLHGELREAIDPRFGKSPRELMQGLGTLFRAVWPEIWIYHVERVMAELEFAWSRPRTAGTEARPTGGGDPEKEPSGAAPLHRKFVISDVRLRNEAEWIKSRGGVLVRLERSAGGDARPTSAVGVPGHISEIDLDGWPGWDFVIENNGTVVEIQEQLEGIVKSG